MIVTPKNYLAQLMSVTRYPFTDEQEDIILNFNDSAVVWADPGTGKTATVVAGLYMAIQMFKIPAESIYALSFTNVATSELRTRFTTLAKRMRISSPNVNFKTLHSLAMQVIRENFATIGIKSKPEIGDSSLKAVVKKLEAIATDAGKNYEGERLKSLARAIMSLNSSLTFDEDAVRSKQVFKKLGMTYEDFTYFRYRIYLSNIRGRTIPRGETCLYALAILETSSDIANKYKNQIELMVVDESQDMSLLQLRLASLLCKKLILVGDIKQQIYAFNGACAEILTEYKKLFPTAKEFALTHSFRCGRKIADFATKIILPNEIGGEGFTGRDKNESVEVTNSLDYQTIIDDLSLGMKKNNGVLQIDVMFACRNNVSLIPIIDALYEKKIPAQIPNYLPINEMPIIKDLVALVQLAVHPENIDNGLILNTIIPEFSHYGFDPNPIMQVASRQGISLTAVRYRFKNDAVCSKLLADLVEVREAVLKKRPVAELFNLLWKSYWDLYLNYHKRYLEQEPDYYIGLVAQILRKRTYGQFIDTELEKHNWFTKCTNRMEGVQCYTFHSSKGMEADCVYLLDVNEGILPDVSRLRRTISSHCELEAAIALRNERNLLYVACTRAKTKLVITYREELACLVQGRSPEFEYLDEIYKNSDVEYDDIEYFLKFSRGEVHV